MRLSRGFSRGFNDKLSVYRRLIFVSNIALIAQRDFIFSFARIYLPPYALWDEPHHRF